MNIPPNLSQQSLQPMQQPPPPPQQQISQQPQEKLDNISKVKSLIVPLRESLAVIIHITFCYSFKYFQMIQFFISELFKDCSSHT